MDDGHGAVTGYLPASKEADMLLVGIQAKELFKAFENFK